MTQPIHVSTFTRLAAVGSWRCFIVGFLLTHTMVLHPNVVGACLYHFVLGAVYKVSKSTGRKRTGLDRSGHVDRAISQLSSERVRGEEAKTWQERKILGGAGKPPVARGDARAQQRRLRARRGRWRPPNRQTHAHPRWEESRYRARRQNSDVAHWRRVTILRRMT